MWTNIYQNTHAGIKIIPLQMSRQRNRQKTYWYPNTSSWPNSSACSHCPISMLLSNARSRTFTCKRSNGWNKPCCFFKQTLHVSRSEEMLRWSVMNWVIHTVKVNTLCKSLALRSSTTPFITSSDMLEQLTWNFNKHSKQCFNVTKLLSFFSHARHFMPWNSVNNL